MRGFKKVLGLVLTVALATSVFTACGNSKKGGDNDNDKKKIGIITMVENGAFMDMKEGILEELKAKGYTEDNTTFDYQCASGDATTLSTIASNMADGSYTAVFTIATPPTQTFVSTESDTPAFFCAVSAPLAAKVLTDMDKPDMNATGTSNAIPVSEIIDFAQATTPAKKYGLIYSGNEDNATNTIKQVEEYLKKNNL